MQPNEIALRKRSQISKANRTMFLWIAIASALIGAAIVVSIFLSQKLMYHEKVLAVKQKTVSTLDHNNSVISALEDEIRVLDTNSALASAKANENDQAVRVILDALPAEANSLALGASLQNRLLANIADLSIETLQVDPVIGVETLTGGDAGTVATTDGSQSANVITFQFVVKGTDNSIKEALQNLERSIRTIEIVNVKIEVQGQTPVMTVQARAYYEPTKTIELTEEVVKP